jgi:hypothetical protein
MNKTKCMLVGFAIFVASLMLMTPTMARPIQEIYAVSVIESQQTTVDSLESTIARIEKDTKIKYLATTISRDSKLSRLGSAIENTQDIKEQTLLVLDYIKVLESKQSYVTLRNYLESVYSLDTASIADELQAKIYGQDECAPYWPGFLHNYKGEIYIPGLGWVPESEYGWIEDLLRDIWNFIVGAIATLVDIITIGVLLTAAGISALTWLITGTLVGGTLLWLIYSMGDLFDGENHQTTFFGELVWCLLNYDNLVGGFADGFNFSWDVLMWLINMVLGDGGLPPNAKLA